MLLKRAKRLIRDGISHLPGEGRAIVSMYHTASLLKRHASSKLAALRRTDQPDPETVYWIDPQRVIHLTNYSPDGQERLPKDRVFDHTGDKGRIIGGSWDHSDLKFDDLDVAQALKARIEANSRWEETAFYKRMAGELNTKGHSGWDIQSMSDLQSRCAYLDRLIESMRTSGYQLSQDVVLAGESKGTNGHAKFGSEIVVNIGRSGEYLFQDGRHRLAIARILGIKKVPVKVLVRHSQWVEFRQFVRSLSMSGGASKRPGELYQSARHPDLQDIPSAHACEDRGVALREHVKPGSGDVLDIGSNLGFFCHVLEELGYNCFAVEYLPQVAMAADKIRIAEGKKFTVVNGDLFAVTHRPPLANRHFEVVLALNIFHHFLKKPETFAKLKHWLGQLQTETMIFEPHQPEESQMVGSHVNFQEQEFVDFILGNSVLNHSRLIHRCHDGRPMYMLWR